MRSFIYRIEVSFIFLLFVGITYTQAATINVSTISALQTAIDTSSANDVLVLANGTYNNSTINISKSNITVKAATLGGVYLNGTNSITINGNYTTFSGFQFTSGAITTIVIWVYGSHNILTQLNFKGYSAQKYITLIAGSQHNEISYCNFENKPTTAPIGNLIHIDPSATVPGYHKIHHNSFQNMQGAGGDNGNECIRISNGATSTYVSRTIVEYNYFNNTGLGDSEAISNKCRENVIRYNTMENNQTAMFCFRNGDNCVAYGNFFINAGGIRVKEANNIYCYNNYFENAGVGGTMDAVTYVYYTVNTLNVLNNINFIHNTFVDCGNIDLGGVGATNNTWANNILKKTAGRIFINPNNGTSWAGNINNGSLGISISSGMTSVNPLLTLNTDGFYGLSASSPCINAGNANYPKLLYIPGIDTLLLDIQKQTRPVVRSSRDVGSEEYNAAGTVINKPLKLTDVGPTYLQLTSGTIGIENTRMGFTILANPFGGNLHVSYSLYENSKISIDLVNLNGQLIKSLANNITEFEGKQKHSFNLSDLNSGVYVVKLRANNFTETSKIIVNN